jgi:hypothetical protein
MSERINEHDMTKKMMDIIRNGKKIITEFVNAPSLDTQPTAAPLTPGDDLPEPEVQTDVENDGKYNEIDGTDGYYKDELQKINDIVDGSAKFTTVAYSTEMEDVVVKGEIKSTRKDGKQGILFTFSLLGGEYTDGIKFNLDTQYVDSSDPIVNDITDKLTGYYPKWSEDAWTYITEMQTRSKNQ